MKGMLLTKFPANRFRQSLPITTKQLLWELMFCDLVRCHEPSTGRILPFYFRRLSETIASDSAEGSWNTRQDVGSLERAFVFGTNYELATVPICFASLYTSSIHGRDARCSPLLDYHGTTNGRCEYEMTLCGNEIRASIQLSTA